VSPRLFDPVLATVTFSASVNTVVGVKYQLERNDRVESGEWRPVGQQVLGNGGTMSLTDPTATNVHAIYRARAQ